MDRAKQYLRFIEETERLKSVTRTAWTSEGRRESTAEHSWRLALFAAVLAEEYPRLDWKKIVLMSLIHDIGEIYGGDVSAVLSPDQREKYRAERAAAVNVFSYLPESLGDRLMALWEEYNEASTPEAELVKALDKAETIIQHNQGSNPADFDYGFNLNYGKEYFENDELMRDIRARIDGNTRMRMSEEEAK